MTQLHIEKKFYKGYCVGTCKEYPGVVVWAKSDEELKQQFKKAIPAHEVALEKHHVKNMPEDSPKVEVISIDREDMGQ